MSKLERSSTVILQRDKVVLSDAGQTESGGPKSLVGIRSPGFTHETTTPTSDCPRQGFWRLSLPAGKGLKITPSLRSRKNRNTQGSSQVGGK